MRSVCNVLDFQKIMNALLVIVSFRVARFYDKINIAQNTYYLIQIVTEYNGEDQNTLVRIESTIGLNEIRIVEQSLLLFVQQFVKKSLFVYLCVYSLHYVLSNVYYHDMSKIIHEICTRIISRSIFNDLSTIHKNIHLLRI